MIDKQKFLDLNGKLLDELLKLSEDIKKFTTEMEEFKKLKADRKKKFWRTTLAN